MPYNTNCFILEIFSTVKNWDNHIIFCLRKYHSRRYWCFPLVALKLQLGNMCLKKITKNIFTNYIKYRHLLTTLSFTHLASRPTLHLILFSKGYNKNGIDNFHRLLKFDLNISKFMLSVENTNNGVPGFESGLLIMR